MAAPAGRAVRTAANIAQAVGALSPYKQCILRCGAGSGAKAVQKPRRAPGGWLFWVTFFVHTKKVTCREAGCNRSRRKKTFDEVDPHHNPAGGENACRPEGNKITSTKSTAPLDPRFCGGDAERAERQKTLPGGQNNPSMESTLHLPPFPPMKRMKEKPANSAKAPPGPLPQVPKGAPLHLPDEAFRGGPATQSVRRA